jgi:hypothetical protein
VIVVLPVGVMLYNSLLPFYQKFSFDLFSQMSFDNYIALFDNRLFTRGYLRVTTGSIWPVAGAHAAVNVAWGISMEVSQTKSTLVLEYIGGESGILMICGLLAADAVLIRRLRRATRGART